MAWELMRTETRPPASRFGASGACRSRRTDPLLTLAEIYSGMRPHEALRTDQFVSSIWYDRSPQHFPARADSGSTSMPVEAPRYAIAAGHADRGHRARTETDANKW